MAQAVRIGAAKHGMEQALQSLMFIVLESGTAQAGMEMCAETGLAQRQQKPEQQEKTAIAMLGTALLGMLTKKCAKNGTARHGLLEQLLI